MKTSFVLTERAKKDLEEISDYIGKRNPMAADKLLNDFEQAFQLLVNSPQIAHFRSDLTKRIQELV